MKLKQIQRSKWTMMKVWLMVKLIQNLNKIFLMKMKLLLPTAPVTKFHVLLEKTGKPGGGNIKMDVWVWHVLGEISVSVIYESYWLITNIDIFCSRFLLVVKNGTFTSSFKNRK